MSDKKFQYKGDASFNMGGTQCDNCGDDETEFFTTYKPKTNEERETTFCHTCVKGFVLCVYNAGLLE